MYNINTLVAESLPLPLPAAVDLLPAAAVAADHI
jgi:hypothetical protein